MNNEQPFFEGFLESDTETREQMIDETTRQLHLAREFIRYDKALKLCKSPTLAKTLERYKQETLKLMQRS